MMRALGFLFLAGCASAPLAEGVPAPADEVAAAPCGKGCSGPTPDDTHPLDHEEALVHLRAFGAQPLGGEPSLDLETLLFHRQVALETLASHGELLDPSHRTFLATELSRNTVEVSFRLVDDDGTVRGEAVRVSNLKEKQHIPLRQTGTLKHIEIAGKTKRVGLHHLWSRW